ncbi:hypothetical protein EV180_001396 [Coemansia sp. RSA 518]|nr:hypothetical protein EV180_001396 [Coemansia sp. RSA 518]
MDSPDLSLSNRGTTPPPFPGGAHSQSNAPDLPAGFGNAEFHERHPDHMTIITEDDSVGSVDFDMAEWRAVRRRQLLED